MKENNFRTKTGNHKSLAVWLTVCGVLIALIAAVFIPKMFSKTPSPFVPNNDTEEHSTIIMNPDHTDTDKGLLNDWDPIGSGSFISTGTVTDDLPFSVVSLKASDDNMQSLPLDGTFTLQTDKTTDTAALENVIRVTPMTAVQLTSLSNDTFTLSPKSGSWRADTLYRITLGDPKNPVSSIAFQTQHVFSVKSTLPGADTTSAPADTGIEITFTDPVRKANLAEYLSVSPAISCSCSLYPDGKTAVLIPDKDLATGTVYTVTVKAGLPSDNGTVLSEDYTFKFSTVSALEYDDKNQDVSCYFYSDPELLVSPKEGGAFVYNAGVRFYNRKTEIRNENAETTEIHAVIWKYPDAASALSALAAREAAAVDTVFSDESTYVFPTDGLSRVFDGTLNFETVNAYERTMDGIATLPKLDKGIYLCEITHKGRFCGKQYEVSRQMLVQSSELRTYTESSENSMLIWLNHINGSAAGNVSAAAYLFDTPDDWKSGDKIVQKTVKTDKNGITELDTEGKSLAFLLLSERDDAQIVSSVTAFPTDKNIYYSYVYTDRETYFSNDTVRFWGTVEKAFPGQTLPSVLYLNIGSAHNGTEIAVNPDGTFSGSFNIEDWTAQGISFTLTDGNNNKLIYHFIRVTQEDKPVYTMDVSFDKPFYTYGETASITVKTAFYDGTPAPGLHIYINADPFGDGFEAITDENGEAHYSYRLGSPYSWQKSTDPMMLNVWTELIGYETTSLTDQAYAYYFHASANFRGERKNTDEAIVTLNKLDTGCLLSEKDFQWDVFPRNTDGAPLKDNVSVQLVRTEFKRVEDGYTYDPYSKRKIAEYHYNEQQTVENSYTAVTENGTLSLPLVDCSGLNGYRTYIVSWCDPQNGHTYEIRLSAARGKEYADNYDPDERFELVPDKTAALIGDTVNVSLMLGQKQYTDSPVLLTRYNANAGRVYKGIASELQFDFSKDDVLGTILYATVFSNGAYQSAVMTGTDGYTTQSTIVSYDFENGNALDVTVSTDKESYKPGETAKITVSVPGVTNGQVLVSLVDEACFTLGEQNALPLNSFFQSVYNRSVYNRSSRNAYGGFIPYFSINERFSCFSSSVYVGYAMIQRRYNGSRGIYYGDYENGDLADEEAPAKPEADDTGGADKSSDTQSVYVREYFADNPYFAVTEIKNGVGTAEIVIPDNITSWRVTALASTGLGDSVLETKLGAAVTGTVCTLPYFVNVSACEIYITGDEVSLSARSYGTVLSTLSDNAQTSYTAILTDDAGNTLSTLTAADTVGTQVWFNFGKLEAGSYTVQVEGRCGDCADAVKETFTVTDTGILMNVRRTLSVSELSSLSPKAYPVTLVFHDDTYDTYLSVLNRLLWTGVSRTDTLAASYAAQKAYEVFYDDSCNNSWYRRWFRSDDAKKTLSVYNDFLPLISYGEGDPVLTAKVLYAVPDVLNTEIRTRLSERYQSFVAEGRYADENELCASMMALAALGEPILNDLYSLAAQAEDFPADAQLSLCAAFAAAGDYPAAKVIWDSLIDRYGEANEYGESFFAGRDTEETIALTAQALLPASLLDRPAAERMVKYLLSHNSTFQLYSLELASYVTHFLPTEVKESTFTYTLSDGKPQTVHLRGNKHFTLTLTKSDFRALCITDADDAVRISASYAGTLDEALADRTPTGELKIRKTIEKYRNNGNTVDGMYLVTISYSGRTDRNSISFSLADCIPSGARYVSTIYHDYNKKSDNSSAYIYNKAGQQMVGTISAYCNRKYDNNGMPLPVSPYEFSGSVSYLIRGAVKGEFSVEPAAALSYDSALYALTDKMTVTIRDGSWIIK